MGYRRRTVYRGRHCKVDFELDRKGIAAIAMSDELLDAVTEVVTDRALPYAISVSPRSTREHKHFQDSFAVIAGTEVWARMRRVASRLWNLSEHAAAVEFGNKHTGGRGHHVLRQTLDHLTGSGTENPF